MCPAKTVLLILPHQYLGYLAKGEIETGPTPVDAPTPRLLTWTRAMRGPTDAPMPPRPTRTFAKLGPIEIPRVEIRAIFGMRTPNTISALP